MPYVQRLGESKGEMIEYTNSEIAEAIDEYIHSKRDRCVLKSRLIDGICFEPLAEMYDMSVRQIKTIVYKGQDIVFRHVRKTH